MGRGRRRHQDTAPGTLLQCLDTAGFVHRRPDHGEIEPFGGADIAEEHFALVQRDAGTERPPAFAIHPGRIDQVEPPQPRLRFHRGR